MLSMTSIRYNHAVRSNKGLPFIRMAAIWPCLLLLWAVVPTNLVTFDLPGARDLLSPSLSITWLHVPGPPPFLYVTLKYGRAWGWGYVQSLLECFPWCNCYLACRLPWALAMHNCKDLSWTLTWEWALSLHVAKRSTWALTRKLAH